MGGRARNSQPIGLRLELNGDTGLYKTLEDKITYCLPFGLMDDLKKQDKHLLSVETWYGKLSKEDNKRVIRHGLPDNTEYFNDDLHAE